MLRIFFRKDRGGHRPVDADLRIVPEDPRLGAGIIKRRALVGEQRPFAQDAKAVGETPRDIHLTFVFSGKHDPFPFAERRGIGPDIDGDIEHLALQHIDELSLSIGVLVMQAAKNPGAGKRKIVLDKVLVDSGFAVLLPAPRLEEKSPRVSKDLRLDNNKSRKGRLHDIHSSSPPPLTIARRYCP